MPEGLISEGSRTHAPATILTYNRMPTPLFRDPEYAGSARGVLGANQRKIHPRNDQKGMWNIQVYIFNTYILRMHAYIGWQIRVGDIAKTVSAWVKRGKTGVPTCG